MNIDKENLLKALRKGAHEGLRTHELADALGADVKGRHRLRTLLDTLVDEAIIEKAPGGRFRIAGAAAPQIKEAIKEAVKTGEAPPRGWGGGPDPLPPARHGVPLRGRGGDDGHV